MKTLLRYPVSVMLLLIVVFHVFTPVSAAPSNSRNAQDVNVYDLVNAVNELRAAYGLAPYTINSILMFTAQNQAEFMAANGIVVHSGPGGSTVTQRLLAAGYPLGGDLSLGGFRSENIIALNGGSAQDAVNAWMGDAPHQYTMLSQDLTEIGAGVSVAGGLTYMVIDCAQPSASGVPVSAASQVVGGGAGVPATEAMIPVVLSTPDADGAVIHEVQLGQTLWQIAISYGVKIDDIKRLNSLAGNDIYPGQKLLVRKDVPSISASPTATAPLIPTETGTPSAIPVSATPAVTATPEPRVVQPASAVTPVVIGIILIAVVGGSVFTWLAAVKRDV